MCAAARPTPSYLLLRVALVSASNSCVCVCVCARVLAARTRYVYVGEVDTRVNVPELLTQRAERACIGHKIIFIDGTNNGPTLRITHLNVA